MQDTYIPHCNNKNIYRGVQKRDLRKRRKRRRRTTMTMMMCPYSSRSISRTSLLSCLIGKVVAAAVPGRKSFSSTTTTAAMKILTPLLPSQWTTNTRLLSSFSVNHPLITTMTMMRTAVVGGVHCHPWMTCLEQGFATKKKKLKKLMKCRLRGMMTTRENIP